MIRLPRFRDYKKGEEETAKLTSEKFKKELRLYERFFDLFMETIDCISESTESKLLDSKGKAATIVILPRVVQSMESIRLLRAIGHYYDSAIIERSLLESIGLCAHLSSNEEEATHWLHGKKIELAAIELLDLVRWLRLGKDAKMKTSYKAIYGQLCNYVHTNISGVASFGRIDKKERRVGGVMSGSIAFQYAPVFDKSGAKGIAVFPLLATFILEIIFKEELKPYKKRQKKSYRLAEEYLFPQGHTMFNRLLKHSSQTDDKGH